MFARLILLVLLAAFALPALANGPCHDVPTAMTGMPPTASGQMPTMPHHEDRTTVPHVCIGCIPPVSLAMRAVAVPIIEAVARHRIAIVAFAPAFGVAPALPPPRLEA